MQFYAAQARPGGIGGAVDALVNRAALTCLLEREVIREVAVLADTFKAVCAVLDAAVAVIADELEAGSAFQAVEWVVAVNDNAVR